MERVDVLVFASEPLWQHTLKCLLLPRLAATFVSTGDAAMTAVELQARTLCGLFLNAFLPDGIGIAVLEHARRKDCKCPAVLFSQVYMRGWLQRAARGRATALDVLDRESVERFVQDATTWRPQAMAPNARTDAAAAYHLTPMEAQVLECGRRGYVNKETAACLGISLNTVKTHISSISRKAGAPGVGLKSLALRLSASADDPPVSATRLVPDITRTP